MYVFVVLFQIKHLVTAVNVERVNDIILLFGN